jgi:hypothetical protein
MKCRGLKFKDADDAYDFFRQREIDEKAERDQIKTPRTAFAVVALVVILGIVGRVEDDVLADQVPAVTPAIFQTECTKANWTYFCGHDPKGGTKT